MSFRVRTDVPFGNAGDVCVRAEGEVAEVSFAPEPHGGPEAMWFCLRLERDADAPPCRTVRLVLENFRNLLGAGDPARTQPVLRADGGDWERLPPGEPVERPDGRVHAVWTFPAPDSAADVALCYPYGPDDVQALVDALGEPWRADTIGLSQAGRPLVRLSNAPGEAGSTRPGLYLVARQHSGETPGSWVLDGLLRRIAALGDRAPLVWATPLANVDGVVQGDYGKDNFPYDLNRAWGAPPMRHETLVMQRDMARWAKRCRPAVGIDLHAPGLCETTGVYAFAPDPERCREQAAAVAPWAEAVGAALAPAYAAEPFSRVASYRSRWETPHFTNGCWAALKLPALSIETPYAVARSTVLTRERYREIGARIADGVLAAMGTP